MKTRVKRILCLVIAVMLCFSLAGCKELDYARAHHAIMQDDGTLLLNGEKYVPLPYCEEFTPPMGEEEYIDVTAPDVPVLLKSFFYIDWYTISDKGTIGDNRIIGDYGQFYCLEEDYAALAARIEAGADMSSMRYFYGVWDDKEGMYIEKEMKLTEEQVNTVKRVMASVEPMVGNSPDGEYLVALEWCSADGLFSRGFGDIYRYNGHYALVNWDEEGGDSMLYEVPAEYNAIFDSIVAPYDASEGYFGLW